MMRVSRAALAMTLVVLVLAGCGSGVEHVERITNQDELAQLALEQVRD